MGNPVTHDDADRFARQYPGLVNADEICSMNCVISLPEYHFRANSMNGRSPYAFSPVASLSAKSVLVGLVIPA